MAYIKRSYTSYCYTDLISRASFLYYLTSIPTLNTSLNNFVLNVNIVALSFVLNSSIINLLKYIEINDKINVAAKHYFSGTVYLQKLSFSFILSENIII